MENCARELYTFSWVRYRKAPTAAPVGAIADWNRDCVGRCRSRNLCIDRGATADVFSASFTLAFAGLMTISNRILGKKNVNGHPHIEAVTPAAALPGGEVRIFGSGLRPLELRQPRVRFGDIEGSIIISADDFVVARVPQGAASGPVVVSTNGHSSNAQQIRVAITIAENLHPVTNPALDAEGNIYVTFSGSRGQKVPVSIFKIDTSYTVKPFLTEMMNATAIAFDRANQMYVSSRF